MVWHGLPCSLKIDEAALDIGVQQLDPHAIADLRGPRTL